jgi:hypothetical protein
MKCVRPLTIITTISPSIVNCPLDARQEAGEARPHALQGSLYGADE